MHQAVYSLNTHPGHATQLGLGHALCILTHMAYIHLDCTHTTCTHVHVQMACIHLTRMHPHSQLAHAHRPSILISHTHTQHPHLRSAYTKCLEFQLLFTLLWFTVGWS